MTNPASPGASAIASALRHPRGVSIIAQTGRSPTIARTAATSPGPSTFGTSTASQSMPAAASASARPQSVSERVDPHDPHPPPVSALGQHRDQHRPRMRLLVRRHRVLQIEDDRIRRQRPRLLERPLLRRGDVKHRPQRPAPQRSSNPPRNFLALEITSAHQSARPIFLHRSTIVRRVNHLSASARHSFGCPKTPGGPGRPFAGPGLPQQGNPA